MALPNDEALGDLDEVEVTAEGDDEEEAAEPPTVDLADVELEES